MNRENKHLFVRFLRQYFKLSISTLVVLLSFSITSFSDPLSSNYGKKSTFLPPLITSSLSDYNGMNISCHGLNDGWIDITVNGIGPFTYSWSTGAITEDISNLVAGTYTVTVTDANSESTIETFILREPDEIVISDNISNTTCANNNGSIDITVTGGMPAFTYLWSNNAITEDITGLAAGSYTVTVTDINNCKDSAAFVVASSTQPVIVIDSVKNISCFNGTDGAVYISVSGNNGPVSYAWSNGSISEDLLNVVVGNYTLTITDSLGCIATTSQAITQPTVIAATLTPVSATCGQNNGSITTSVSGGLHLHILIYGIQVLLLLQLPMWLQVLTLLQLQILNFVQNLSVRLFQIFQALL
ncbi:MAG: adhesin AidA-related protein [Bacteroidetes bacterium OLB10]|nr:MAG: adhesin AidA-related protein [Bacteroidetes bacterium OLB10]